MRCPPAARSSIRKFPRSLLVPVAPHALTHRPIAVADTATIAVTLIAAATLALHCDGAGAFRAGRRRPRHDLRARYAARLLHPEGHDYFAMLREKLHWSETPERFRK